MVDSDNNLHLYKIRSIEILRNRRAFFDLWRRSDDRITTWLERVQSCIRRCQFPKFITEFLLFDRFICGLNANELESIQSMNKSWTLKQLLELYLTDHDTVNQNRNIALSVMKSDSAEEESLQIDSSSELVGEGNPFAFIDPNLIEDEHGLEEIVIVDDTEETCSHLSFDVKEMDNEIPNDTTENFECDDNKFSVANAVSIDEIGEDGAKNYLGIQTKKVRRGRKRNLNTIHNNEKYYACAECDGRFRSPNDLQRHSYTHTGERPFQCDQCDKAFAQPGNLNTHKQRAHTRNRLIPCEKCGKCFATLTDVKRHLLTHTGERPYQCDVCYKSFLDPGYLSTHKKCVHGGVRSYACNECGKCFFSSQNLKNHMTTHSDEKPFACVQCDKAFKLAGNLKIHQKQVHQQRIRQYACGLCDKRFANAKQLENHSRKHKPQSGHSHQ